MTSFTNGHLNFGQCNLNLKRRRSYKTSNDTWSTELAYKMSIPAVSWVDYPPHQGAHCRVGVARGRVWGSHACAAWSPAAGACPLDRDPGFPRRGEWTATVGGPPIVPGGRRGFRPAVQGSVAVCQTPVAAACGWGPCGDLGPSFSPGKDAASQVSCELADLYCKDFTVVNLTKLNNNTHGIHVATKLKSQVYVVIKLIEFMLL